MKWQRVNRFFVLQYHEISVLNKAKETVKKMLHQQNQPLVTIIHQEKVLND